MDRSHIEIVAVFGKVSIGMEHLVSLRVLSGGARSATVLKGLVLHYSFNRCLSDEEVNDLYESQK